MTCPHCGQPLPRGKELVKRGTAAPDVDELQKQIANRDRLHAETDKAVTLIFAYFIRRLGRGRRYLLDRKREQRLRRALIENRGDVSELLDAIDGAYKDDWIMGRDAGSRGYVKIETVFRDRDQIERLAGAVPTRRSAAPHPFIGFFEAQELTDDG